LHSCCVEVELGSGGVGEEVVPADGKVGWGEGWLVVRCEVELEGYAWEESEEVGVG
jgi:hypothetical protein